VRYAPNSRFSAHTHNGGEEFLVLDGTFSDDYGDFPTGTYVRNPVGSKHTPHTDRGCLILVKLWWMHQGDREFVRIDTTRADLWRPSGDPGVEVMPLHRFGDESVALYRLGAGAELSARSLPGGEELFVLDGACRDANGHYGKGDWVRTPIGDAPALLSAGGARLYVKRGHLLSPPPVPDAHGA
jgi:anti-sigma factor ChrR (cupin superfamily)